MDERKAFEAWQGSRKPSYPAEWEAWQTAWQAATAAERERAAKVLEGQRYMTLQPLRKYTADETCQLLRNSVKNLADAIRKG